MTKLPALENMPEPTQPDTEFGVRLTGLPFSDGYIANDGLLHQRPVPSIRQLVDMRKHDGQARGLYRLIVMPIRAALKRATFIPDDNNGEKEAEHITDLFTLPTHAGGMETSLTKVGSQMLMAVFDGFAPFELVYTKPKFGPLEGKWALRKIAYRPAETVYVKVTKNGDFDGLHQKTVTPDGTTVDKPFDKLHSFYFACSEEENPYYGVSYFNAAFYHYDKKVKLYYLAHLAAQHRAVGSRFGTYPVGASPKEIAAFRRALQDFGLAQSVTVPDKGFKVEDLGKSLGDFPFMDFINHHNSQMSKSVLSPFFDEAQGGEKSVVDFGSQSDSMYMMMIETLVGEMETAFNDFLIPRFVDWNIGSEKYPKIKFGSFSDDQKRVIATTFDKLMSAGQGANVTRPFMLELEKYMAGELGLEIDYEQASKALKKQEDETYKFFEQSLGGPPMSPPFQAIPTAPADRQPGVAPQQQFIPGNAAIPGATGPGQLPFNPAVPITGPGMAPGNEPRQGKLGRPPKTALPALPSQLTAEGAPAASTWLGAEDLVALSQSDESQISDALQLLGAP